jgi:DNA topoisomerase-1
MWICPHATGRDAKGASNIDTMPAFARCARARNITFLVESLPAIRRKVEEHLTLRGVPRERVLATVVHLLKATLIRVGGDEYARNNKSYGLTTLENRHVEVDGSALRFNFKGKGGKVWKLSLS